MPVIMPDTESPEFDTTAAAAHALSAKFKSQKDDNKETAGILYKKPNGKFVYSTTLHGTGDHFELQAGLPKGHSIAGILHTHPTDAIESQVFSPDDINIAKHLNVPSYVNFLHDGSMRVFTPGKTMTQSMRPSGSSFSLNVAHGDVVPPPAPIQAPADTQPAVAAAPPDTQPPPLPPFAAFAATPQS
jgi:hypothetical protein